MDTCSCLWDFIVCPYKTISGSAYKIVLACSGVGYLVSVAHGLGQRVSGIRGTMLLGPVWWLPPWALGSSRMLLSRKCHNARNYFANKLKLGGSWERQGEGHGVNPAAWYTVERRPGLLSHRAWVCDRWKRWQEVKGIYVESEGHAQHHYTLLLCSNTWGTKDLESALFFCHGSTAELYCVKEYGRGENYMLIELYNISLFSHQLWEVVRRRAIDIKYFCVPTLSIFYSKRYSFAMYYLICHGNPIR